MNELSKSLFRIISAFLTSMTKLLQSDWWRGVLLNTLGFFFPFLDNFSNFIK